MAKILVYDSEQNTMETYYRELYEPMPYVKNNTLTVKEFKANSVANIVWTDKQCMNAWNAFRGGWGSSIYVGFAFKRIWEGGHASQSQHYAGLALDVGQNLTYNQRDVLRNYAVQSKVWTYVEPSIYTPTWIHVDKRYGTPACSAGGFPSLTVGSKGVYVLVLQDSLMALGFLSSGLDGVFGSGTKVALVNYQQSRGISVSGVCDCATWQMITSEVGGLGQTKYVQN